MSTILLRSARDSDRTEDDSRGRRAGFSVAVVVAAVLVAGAIWLLATAAGVPLYQPGFGGSAPQPLAFPWTIAVAALASIAARGSLRLVERFAPRRAPTVWLGIAAVALILSLGGPMSGTGISVENRLVLVSIHAAVAAVLVPAFYGHARVSAARARGRA